MSNRKATDEEIALVVRWVAAGEYDGGAHLEINEGFVDFLRLVGPGDTSWLRGSLDEVFTAAADFVRSGGSRGGSDEG